MKYLFGYSYIELLISVSILAIIGVMVTPYMSSFISGNQLRLTEDAFSSMVKKSQSYAIANKNNAVWGVCLHGSDIRVYSGSCNAPVIKDDYVIPQSITVSGLSDFQFSKGRGELSSSEQIIMSSSVDSVTIDISPLGAIVLN